MDLKVLVVDDDVGIRTFLSTTLSKAGADVVTATSGQETRDAVAKDHFHAAIIDVDLGDEDGLDLLRFLKSSHPQTDVFLYSGSATDPELPIKAANAGAKGYFRKAGPMKELLAEVLGSQTAEKSGRDGSAK